MFESKYEILRVEFNYSKMKPSELKEITTFGEKSIFHYKELIDFIVPEYEKSEDKTLDDFTTIITLKLNLARLYSKLAFKEVEKKVESMALSLRMYEDAAKTLKKSHHIKNNQNLLEQLRICEEMASLLPNKIHKINRREED
jgi:hypothetical protein